MVLHIMKTDKYYLQPPDGGWGYLIAAATAVALHVTINPMGVFGLIFGPFLSEIGDETTGTTLANSMFNCVLNFTANGLLQKYTYRFVGILGACIYFAGNFSLIFVNSVPQLVFSFGVVQGIGMGLMFPSLLTALTSYFDKKLNLMNSLAQTFTVVGAIFIGPIVRYLMDSYGFRGTLAILAALSLHTIFAGIVLQPVEWHSKRIPRRYSAILTAADHPISEEDPKPPAKPLLDLILEEEAEDILKLPGSTTSIVSLGAVSLTAINKLEYPDTEKRESCWKRLTKSLDLDMFKDPVYMNISIGMALAFTADVAFIAIIPLILTNGGLDNAQTTWLVTCYFSADLVGRILLSGVTLFCRFRNRYLILGGAVLSAVFRTAFVMGDGFYWKMATLSILGFLRTFIQTPLPLVMSDEYSEKFSTAFSLYMVVCGFVSLVFGPLQSIVKSLSGSDVMVVHLLSSAYLTCAVIWSVELLFRRRKNNTKTNFQESNS